MESNLDKHSSRTKRQIELPSIIKAGMSHEALIRAIQSNFDHLAGAFNAPPVNDPDDDGTSIDVDEDAGTTTGGGGTPRTRHVYANMDEVGVDGGTKTLLGAGAGSARYDNYTVVDLADAQIQGVTAVMRIPEDYIGGLAEGDNLLRMFMVYEDNNTASSGSFYFQMAAGQLTLEVDVMSPGENLWSSAAFNKSQYPQPVGVRIAKVSLNGNNQGTPGNWLPGDYLRCSWYRFANSASDTATAGAIARISAVGFEYLADS